jgi:hypothetical protein
MNRRDPASTGSPNPTTRNAGEDRCVGRRPVERRWRQIADGTDTVPHPRTVIRRAARDQSAQSDAGQFQIGVTDQAARPQSP